MTLWNKLLLLISAALVLLLVLIAGGSWVLLHANLEEAERIQVKQEAERSLQAFQNELNDLNAHLWEYAVWDDTYAFVENGNAAYVQSNLVDNIFSDRRLNAIVILNRAHRIIFGSGYDLKAEHKTLLPAGLIPYLKRGSLLTDHPNIKSTRQGILSLPEGPFIFASRPILSSIETGPSRGTMIMGRFFTPSEIKRLGGLAHQRLTFYPLGDHRLAEDLRQELLKSQEQSHVAVKAIDASVVAGYMILSDIFGKPALVMQVEVPRVLHQQGEQSIHALVVGILFVGFVLGLLILFLLEHLVLSRLKGISDEVGQIGTIPEDRRRVSVTGRDELAGLAVQINTMLNTIEASQKALQEESDRYRAVVQDQTEGICRFDLEGKLIFANEALGRYLNMTPEELLGRKFFDVFPWENVAEIRAELSAIKADQPVSMFDAKMIFPDQRVRHSRWTVRAILREHGEIGEYQAVGRDITSRIQAEIDKKALEEQFFQSQKMDAIGTLAGGIAHDFNNILMGIGGYVSLMLYDIDIDHPHYKKLKAIEEQIKNASLLTRDLLGFARGGAYEVKPHDLNHILETTSAIFSRSRKDIEIRQRFAADLWTVKADRGQMEQVFMNLFVNAGQAMPAGGKLYLETKNVSIAAAQGEFVKMAPGPYVQVSVTDEGVGMDEETKERIFEPFFTTHDRGKRGAGLGLASVYGIVKNHGGMINVYTEKGVGTTFRLYLPAISASAVLASSPDWGNQQLPRGTEGILVVEDEELLMDVTVKILNILGYRSFPARSGEEALQTYREKRGEIELILLDMVMPGMSGEETFRKLKEIHPEVKVILASGYSLNEQATRIMDNGCRAFLQKPYNTFELSRTLREVLDELF
jgi:PAS domain S-box-containing protein